MEASLLQIVETCLIGGVAGLLGGLAGIGGSMIMLPALHIFYPEQERGSVHHMYMAAAMIVNLAVAIPAARRHRKLGGVRPDIFHALVVSTLIAAAVGVLTSNLISGNSLKLLLAGFLGVYCVYNMVRLIQGPNPQDAPDEPVAPWRLHTTGCSTGFTAGLLGLGGGVVMVPMLQMLCNVRLRKAIGTSSSVMVFTAVIGATLKTFTLPQVGERITDALYLAAMMAPGAVIGATIGATLTHRLPIRVVRTVISILLVIAAYRLAEGDVRSWFA
ncbi:MAG: sulfite exporter TauE/SafE family protein [Phycisphaeraceae bacterium]|nr:sulfite exporter TauE/SafE family protein [Phycisphaeraceae bacterium]